MLKVSLDLDSKTKKALERLDSNEFSLLLCSWLEAPNLGSVGLRGPIRTIVTIDNGLYAQIRLKLIELGLRDPHTGLSCLINGLLVTKKSEKAFQIELANTIAHVKMEVNCPIGRIDILSPTELIECKHYGNVNAFKHALGQVLAYGYYYPDRALKLALIGRPKGQELVEVQRVCAHFKVALIWL